MSEAKGPYKVRNVSTLDETMYQLGLADGPYKSAHPEILERMASELNAAHAKGVEEERKRWVEMCRQMAEGRDPEWPPGA